MYKRQLQSKSDFYTIQLFINVLLYIKIYQFNVKALVLSYINM